VFLAKEQGLLKQHNTKNIPNWANLRPAFNLAENFSAGVVDATHTLFFNTNQVKDPIAGWADLWDAKWKGKIAIPPVGWNSGVRMITSAAQIATGKPHKDAQYEWEAGIAHLAKLKQNGVVVYQGAPQAIQSVQSGQIPVIAFYGIFINPLIDGGAPIKPVTQIKEGKHGEIVGMNMPANAKNVELAEAYVNMSLDKSFQEKIDSVLRSPASHKDVAPSARTMELNGPLENITYADWAFLSKNRAKMAEKWNEVFG
jgi:putative spermidine/putrescine transport system substrate-binding protein